MAGGPEHHLTEHAPPTETPQHVPTAGGTSGGHCVFSDRASKSSSTVGRPATRSNSTGRRATHRPVTQSTTCSGPITRFSGSRRARGVLVPLIEVPTDSEEEWTNH